MVMQICNICWIWWMNGNFSVKLLQSLFSHQRNMWSHAILVDMLVKFFIINSGWISLIAVFSWSKWTKYLFKSIIYFYKRDYCSGLIFNSTIYPVLLSLNENLLLVWLVVVHFTCSKILCKYPLFMTYHNLFLKQDVFFKFK